VSPTVDNATEFTTPSDSELQIRRVFDAPRDLVWEALTKPEHLRNWMLGPQGWRMTVCEIDLRPDGRYCYQWRHTSGEQMQINGVYRELRAPERIVNTENWGGEWPETLNTVTLAETKDGQTTVTTVARYPSREARDAALQSGMQDGVNLSYGRLEHLLLSMPNAV
jgi:uncharacterized protein YndB with AHSA1/START domain